MNENEWEVRVQINPKRFVCFKNGHVVKHGTSHEEIYEYILDSISEYRPKLGEHFKIKGKKDEDVYVLYQSFDRLSINLINHTEGFCSTYYTDMDDFMKYIKPIKI